MQNIVINMCEKFNCDRLRNDRALGNGKLDNNNPQKKHSNRATLVALGDLFPGPTR